MMEFEFIEYVKMESGIGRIYLNRPEKRNALCNPLRTELFSCLETLDKDHEIKVIILSTSLESFSFLKHLLANP